MGTWFKIICWHLFKHIPKMSQKCEQFSYWPFVWDVWGFWDPKWSPYVAEASLGRVYIYMFIHIYIYIYIYIYMAVDLFSSVCFIPVLEVGFIPMFHTYVSHHWLCTVFGCEDFACRWVLGLMSLGRPPFVFCLWLYFAEGGHRRTY